MKALKDLEHISKASDWISDGDLVDRMIHGCVDSDHGREREGALIVAGPSSTGPSYPSTPSRRPLPPHTIFTDPCAVTGLGHGVHLSLSTSSPSFRSSL